MNKTNPFANRPALLILFFNGIANCSWAANVTASDCSATSVRAAISAAANGDTVIVPPGSCSWSGVSLPNNKKLTLQGAGMDATIITGDVAFGNSGSRVTGFTFTGEPNVSSNGYGFRLDHCRLRRNTWNNIVTVKDYNPSPRVPFGLVDHNDIINGRVNAEGTPYMLNEGNQQHALWATPLDLGGPNAVYVEDNTFSTPVPAQSQVAIDANYGGRFVFRYNTVSDGLFLTAHSSQEGGNRGTQSWEIYGNDISHNSSAAIYAPIRIRAGTGVAFDNSVTGRWSDPSILLDNVRSYAPSASGGLCNGASRGWDGNEDSSGYPCRDQIGRGPDTQQWSHNPVGTYTQPLVPAFFWSNKNGNNAEVPVSVISWSANHIKLNRDYRTFNGSFDGTSGTGCGTPQARPATCVVGVGYWETTQSCTNLSGMIGAQHTSVISGVLYRCSAPNTWTKFYQPYTYPHPLTQIAASPSELTAPRLTGRVIP